MGDEFTQMINEAVYNARDSKDGKRAVSEHKAIEKNKKGEMHNLFNAARMVKELGESGETRREGHWRKHSADEYGIREFDYDERYNNHLLFVDDVNRYSIEDYKAFNQRSGLSSKDGFGGSVTVLPYKHSGYDKLATPRERMAFDMTYFHEQSHAKGNSGDRKKANQKYDTSIDWTEREEEHLAEEGTLEVLKENMDRDGSPYSREVGQQALLDYYEGEPVENKSSKLYRDRMEYLPNPDDNMDERAKEYYSEKSVRTTDNLNQPVDKKINNARELQLHKRDEELRRRASGFNIKWGDDGEDPNLHRKLMATGIAEDFEKRFIKSTEQE